MQYYEYKTRSHADGKIYKGIITADNMEAAEDSLKRRGEDIVILTQMQDFLNIRKFIYSLSTHANKKTKLEFFTMLKFMIEAGMSLHESLVNIRDTGMNKPLKGLSAAMADEVRKGASLSRAMKKSEQFDETTVEQLKAGEESGNINGTITRLIGQIEREIEFKSKIKSAMIYPIIICVVMVVVLWVMMTVVVPSLAETLVSMGGELPLITKIVIGVSNGMSKATPFLIVLLIAAVITYRIAIKNENFKLMVDSRKLKIPIVGTMIERIELSKFCRNLSAMQKSGITLVSSLQIVVSAITNQKISKEVKKAARLVEISGMNLATALAKAGHFPAMMLQLVEVGIGSGKITDVLDKVAEQYEKEVDVSLKRIVSLIEPALIVVVGLLAGTVVIAIFIPMFSMVDNMGV